MRAVEIPKINLFIVGAAKSGTTSLYHYLKQHPDIYLPLVKEPNFFSNVESTNPAAYLKPRKNKFYHNKVINDRLVYYNLYKGAQSSKILADASPSYLWDPNAAQKIHKHHSYAKIIILLRNPVERAFSHYLMDVKEGIQAEREFIEAIEKDNLTRPKVWGKAHLYLELGLYHDQVKRYLELFGEKKVKVILYQEFISNTRQVLEQICEFLHVDYRFVENINYNKIHNKYVAPRGKVSKTILTYKNKIGFIKNLTPKFLKDFIRKHFLFKEVEKPRLNHKSKEFLYNYYKSDIDKMEKLLNIDLSDWRVT